MSDKDKKQQNQDDEKIHITKNIFETSREAKQKAIEEEQKKAAERERLIAERRKKEQEDYDRKIEAERLELLRLKQGIIEESEIIPENQPEEVIKLNFFQKIGDFFYQNKWWLWIAAVFVFILVCLIMGLVTRPRPDMVVLVIGENYNLGEESELSEYVSSFADDFNGNGEILVSVYYIPYSENSNKNYANGVDSKLTAELQLAEGVILIGNKLTEEILFEDSLADLSEIYPENEHVNGRKFMLSGTDFAKKVNLSESDIPDDWFISIRRPKDLLYSSEKEMQEVYDRDFVVFDSIINDLTK